MPVLEKYFGKNAYEVSKRLIWDNKDAKYLTAIINDRHFLAEESLKAAK